MKAIIDSKSLNRIIDATKRFVRKSEQPNIYQYIRLEFVKDGSLVSAVSCDGFRLSVEKSIFQSVDEDFVAYITPTIPKCPARVKDVFIERMGDMVLLHYGDTIHGSKQPSGDYLDYKTSYDDVVKKPPVFTIGFNPNFLFDALQSAKASIGGVLQKPVILEFRGDREPALMKTGDGNIKMILPVRTPR